MQISFKCQLKLRYSEREKEFNRVKIKVKYCLLTLKPFHLYSKILPFLEMWHLQCPGKSSGIGARTTYIW